MIRSRTWCCQEPIVSWQHARIHWAARVGSWRTSVVQDPFSGIAFKLFTNPGAEQVAWLVPSR
ncbi:hypothetical protein V5F01_05760 [Streptomyces sp. NRRL B-2790]|uniref:hypothetical protein n=1 Tax=Streptomyces sp. NRRL B-2790 TaxID=1463835 RepID=UPI000A4E09EF